MDEEVRHELALDEPCSCGSGLPYGECCGAEGAVATATEEPAGEAEGAAEANEEATPED